MGIVADWMLAAFWAFTFLAALAGAVGSLDSGGGRPGFFAFLRICSLLVGFNMAQMHLELRECPSQGASNHRGPSVSSDAFTLLEVLVVTQSGEVPTFER